MEVEMALVSRRLHSLGECNLGERFCNVRVLRLEYLALRIPCVSSVRF